MRSVNQNTSEYKVIPGWYGLRVCDLTELAKLDIVTWPQVEVLGDEEVKMLSISKRTLIKVRAARREKAQLNQLEQLKLEKLERDKQDAIDREQYVAEEYRKFQRKQRNEIALAFMRILLQHTSDYEDRVDLPAECLRLAEELLIRGELAFGQLEGEGK